MQIVRKLETLSPQHRGVVLALGNFDGVHLGHQAVIAETRKQATDRNLPAAVMTFEPHPRELFSPELAPLCIYPAETKLRLFKKMGIDTVFLLPFDRELASVSAEDFIRRILVEQIGAKHVVTGDNFIFGKGRGGNPSILQAGANRYDFGYSRLHGVNDEEGEVCSSTRIRQYLKQGAVEEASALLGRDYAIEGPVIHGDKRGRTLGFPTANIATDHIFSPRHGVYVAEAEEKDGTTYQGVANIGVRPTLGDHKHLLEMHCFTSQAINLYDKLLRVRLLHFLREEKSFPSLTALREQIANDSRQAREFFG